MGSRKDIILMMQARHATLSSALHPLPDVQQITSGASYRPDTDIVGLQSCGMYDNLASHAMRMSLDHRPKSILQSLATPLRGWKRNLLLHLSKQSLARRLRRIRGTTGIVKAT